MGTEQKGGRGGGLQGHPGGIQGHPRQAPGTRDIPEPLLPDGEGRRFQREDLGLHEELAHAPVDDFAVLGARVQDHHGALVVVLPILELCPGVLGLPRAPTISDPTELPTHEAGQGLCRRPQPSCPPYPTPR